jgi:hypothetical protein
MSDTNNSPSPRRILRAEVVAIIVALLAQGAGIVWWGSGISQRVTSLESRVAGAQHLTEDMARVDERTKAMDASLLRIEEQLSRKIP